VKFYNAIDSVTDYGFCCHINAYLNFVNPKTKGLIPDDYTAEDYLTVPPGATNGIQGGIQFILDTEAFDYAYWERASSGFRISLTDPRDKPIINQNSIFVAPGETVVTMKLKKICLLLKTKKKNSVVDKLFRLGYLAKVVRKYGGSLYLCFIAFMTKFFYWGTLEIHHLHPPQLGASRQTDYIILVKTNHYLLV